MPWSRDWIESSPAEAIAKTKIETPRDRVLSMDEVKWVYSTAEMLGYPLSGYIRMLFLTGIDSSETKSARSHLVPLSPQTIAILEKTPRLGEFVWTTNGESYLCGYSRA